MSLSTAEKLGRIQSLFDAGKTHAEIAKELGYSNIKSYYHYIYKHGTELRYEKQHVQKKIHLVPSDVTTPEPVSPNSSSGADISLESIAPASNGTSKAEAIVYLLGNGVGLKEVARRKKFKDMQELADYMKSKGYYWNSDRQNYMAGQDVEKPKACKHELSKKEAAGNNNTVTVTEGRGISSITLEQYGSVLRLLSDNRDKLEMLLGGNVSVVGELPRYTLPGVMTAKTFNLVEPLKQLIMDYAEERNVKQMEILYIALIDFFKKYGYGNEVKARLGI